MKKQKALDAGDGDSEGMANEEEELNKEGEENEEENLSAELKATAHLLQANKNDLGVAIFQCLHASKPDIMTIDEFAFGTTVHNRVFHDTFQGTIPLVEPNGWTLLFRYNVQSVLHSVSL